jgi:dihydroorotate dehydrogenase (fumarate)
VADLRTTYLGLELDNPLIVGSSSLTKTVDGVQRAAEAGAGAVVLKSLFEEEVRMNFSETVAAFGGYPHPEAAAYLQADLAAHYGPEEYLRLVEESAKAVDIPVIASINCITPDTWPAYAAKLEAAGAQALELNIYQLPLNPGVSSDDIEALYISAVRAVKEHVLMPVVLKLAPYITNLTRMALQAQVAGAAGLVLFNRFFDPDIDVETMKMTGGLSLSGPYEQRHSLRWVGILYGRTRCELCSSTGIHSGEAIVKGLLSGAQAVQAVSVFYEQGLDVLPAMLNQVSQWMERKNFATIEDFRGIVSRLRAHEPELFDRSQYIKAFVGAE